MGVFYWENVGGVQTPGNNSVISLPVILPDPNIVCEYAHVKKCFDIDLCHNVVLRTKTSMSLVDYNSLQVSDIKNQIIPGEGPRGIPVQLDFTNTGELDIDISQLQQRGFMSMVQTVFVDMSNSPNPLTILVNGIGQRIVCKPNTQGYYTVLVPNPVRLQITCIQGSPIIPIVLCNVPIAGAVWPTT
jgi:hypothetical protein